MTRIRTITYEQAKKWYDSGRKYKPIGTKLTKNIWLNYDAANDRFTLAYTHSKDYEIINEQGEKQYKKACTAERDKYTQEMIGFIYKDHAHIFHPGHLTVSSHTARNFFESYFNCTYRKSPGVKMKGFEWTFFREGLDYWQKTFGAGEVELSGAGLRIYPDGRREVTEPVMVRAHKKEQQNAMNRHIKAVRRMIGLRVKLGGFSSVDWVAFSNSMQTKYGRIHDVIRNPKLINQLFMGIDDENYMTMLPVLWLASELDSRYYRYGAPTPDYDWLRVFNSFVARVRETLRKEQGAVEYVLDESQTT